MIASLIKEGSTKAASNELAFVREQMRQSVPEFLLESLLYRELLDTEAAQLGKVAGNTAELLRQFYVDTATFGLDRWERFCGIPVQPTKPLEQRRAVIKSKLRGIGTVTADVIRSVAESYSNGEVSVQEFASQYKIVITFIGKMGIPPNLEDLQASLRALIPAHLSIEYEYTYLSWANLDKLLLSWNDFDDLKLTWTQTEVFDYRLPIVRSSVGLTMAEQ
ncbi:putative phage tail protein [Paenibacillus arenosi]|uniref:YmfQ family protein n=1 Tax=Paenibacillus arenosi TaxID=2774142 RepID=A0ABR9B4A7_9BACL|nr:putative phage tail protein [Paenibacillus arenosi]MBD8500749.1 YmfQ family protein [Paenibacillus arenosi]